MSWKLSVPESIGAQFELITLDPLTGNQIKGARSKIITELMRAFLIAYSTGETHADLSPALMIVEGFDK